jgi:hypothetical protein
MLSEKTQTIVKVNNKNSFQYLTSRAAVLVERRGVDIPEIYARLETCLAEK